MARSNLFANMENQFEFCDAKEIAENILQGFRCLFQNLKNSQIDGQMIFTIFSIAAKLGVASKNGKLNSKEKALVDATFGQILNEDITHIYDMVASKITENDYTVAKTLVPFGNDVALSHSN